MGGVISPNLTWSLKRLAWTYFLSFVLLGCEATPALQLWHFGPANRGEPETELHPTAVEACEVLGIECQASDQWRGAVYLDLVDAVSGQQGRTPKRPPLRCYPMTRASTDPLIAAHELAHALGVTRHSADPLNLMYSCDAPGEVLNETQRQIVEKSLRRLGRC